VIFLLVTSFFYFGFISQNVLNDYGLGSLKLRFAFVALTIILGAMAWKSRTPPTKKKGIVIYSFFTAIYYLGWMFPAVMEFSVGIFNVSQFMGFISLIGVWLSYKNILIIE